MGACGACTDSIAAAAGFGTASAHAGNGGGKVPSSTSVGAENETAEIEACDREGYEVAGGGLISLAIVGILRSGIVRLATFVYL